MRINRISISELFGNFNHNIPLNADKHITIMHGPNGFGKTVLLTLVHALFNREYNKLRQYPFSELSIFFDNSSQLKVSRKTATASIDAKRIRKEIELDFDLKEPRKKTKSFTLKPTRPREVYIPSRLRMLREMPELDRIGPDMWLFAPTMERLSTEEALERFYERIHFRFSKKKLIPDWFKDLIELVPIRFIEAQRLLSFPLENNHRNFEERPSMVPAVSIYSEELAKNIQEKLTEYAALSQSLDRSFPTRLVKGNGPDEFTPDELKTKLKELEEKRSRLMEAGLLDKEKEVDFVDLRKIDESNRNVLSVYVRDVETKLSVFDEFTNKIDLLVKIINNRFLYKQISIERKAGFKLTTSEGKSISPANLSSGEQHEIVLLYELLFKVSPNSLILIDEPELSLHVVWQQQFLKDLKEITKLAGFDVLIATHSPQIIHDRWDLTVELEGPKA